MLKAHLTALKKRIPQSEIKVNGVFMGLISNVLQQDKPKEPADKGLYESIFNQYQDLKRLTASQLAAKIEILKAGQLRMAERRLRVVDEISRFCAEPYRFIDIRKLADGMDFTQNRGILTEYVKKRERLEEEGHLCHSDEPVYAMLLYGKDRNAIAAAEKLIGQGTQLQKKADETEKEYMEKYRDATAAYCTQYFDEHIAKILLKYVNGWVIHKWNHYYGTTDKADKIREEEIALIGIKKSSDMQFDSSGTLVLYPVKEKPDCYDEAFWELLEGKLKGKIVRNIEKEAYAFLHDALRGVKKKCRVKKEEYNREIAKIRANIAGMEAVIGELD